MQNNFDYAIAIGFEDEKIQLKNMITKELIVFQCLESVFAYLKK